jgi:hypothetical protein
MNNLLERTWLCECEAEGKLPGDLDDTEFGTGQSDFVCGAQVGMTYCPAAQGDQLLLSEYTVGGIAGGLHGYFQHGLNLQGVWPFYCNGGGCPFSFVARCEKRTTSCET